MTLCLDAGGLWAWAAVVVIVGVLLFALGALWRDEQRRYVVKLDAARRELWQRQHDGEWERIQRAFEEESG
jgi:hypothetical protein